MNTPLYECIYESPFKLIGKYKLLETYEIDTPIKPIKRATHGFKDLQTNGHLTIQAGYKWDGPTGALNTKSFMKASLIHDAFCELIHNDKVLPKRWRHVADKLLDIHLKEANVWGIRRWWVRKALRAWAKVRWGL